VKRTPQNKPKYQTVLEELVQDVVGGRYAAGQKFPSEAALVKRFGVSRITIGHAVRELQRRGMVDRVAGSGTYVRGGEGLPRTGLVFGLIIPNLGETEIFEPICQGIAAAPGAEGHALLWPYAGVSQAAREAQALELCRQCVARRVSGVFFAPLEFSQKSGAVNRKVLAMLGEAGIAVVLMDRRPDENSMRERWDLVGIDNHRAGYLAAGHLLGLGSKRIGFLGYQGQAATVAGRVAGYRAALAEAGIGKERVFTVPAGEAGEIPAEALECDAFVAANDRIAGRLMHWLMGQGVRIPEDVRIVGIDDVRYAALLPVPLTTIHQPCREIGEAALGMMLERLERPGLPAREMLFDCSLVIRASCGAAAKKMDETEHVRRE
jgi:GntR family transcriptional regulator of arabinose operon